MNLKSLDGCKLVIGTYPPFSYDARNGGGEATLDKTDKANIQSVIFKPNNFSIPPLTWENTKFLNVPLPPGLKIEMLMDKLEGTIDKNTGEIILFFESRFKFSICSIFFFPDLLVKSLLQSGKVKSNLYEENGFGLRKDGKAKLVGIALIPITGNKVLDKFLDLPNEALAVLNCEIK